MLDVSAQITNNSSSEALILKTACDNKQYQAYIMSQIDEESFSSESTKDLFKRLNVYIQNGNLPSTAVLANDSSLSEATRALLTVRTVLEDKDDIDRTLLQIRTSKNKKIVISTLLNLLQKDATLPHLLTTLENVIQKCRVVQQTSTEMKHIEVSNKQELLNSVNKYLVEDNKKDIVLTGFTEFDSRTGGIFKKNVLVTASVPGGGKSAMALQMAAFQYLCGKRVCIVSYEMDISEIESRLYSNVSRINHSDMNLKKLDDRRKKMVVDRYDKFISATNTGCLTLWAPERELTIPQIAMEIKPRNYDIVYIDYLGLLYNDPKKQMWENLGNHTRDAKLAANSLNAAFVLLAQLDEDNTTKIKYSKAIKANANFVWTWECGDKERESGIIDVRQQKARNAPIYNFYLEIDFSTFTFKDYNGPAPFQDFVEKDDEKKKKKKDDTNAPIRVQNSQSNQSNQSNQNNQNQTISRGIPKMPQLI
jgi:replicative DNA helicase